MTVRKTRQRIILSISNVLCCVVFRQCEMKNPEIGSMLDIDAVKEFLRTNPAPAIKTIVCLQVS